MPWGSVTVALIQWPSRPRYQNELNMTVEGEAAGCRSKLRSKSENHGILPKPPFPNYIIIVGYGPGVGVKNVQQFLLNKNKVTQSRAHRTPWSAHMWCNMCWNGMTRPSLFTCPFWPCYMSDSPAVFPSSDVNISAGPFDSALSMVTTIATPRSRDWLIRQRASCFSFSAFAFASEDRNPQHNSRPSLGLSSCTLLTDHH